MSSHTNNASDNVHRSNPIPIGPRGRSRSVSVSSASSGSNSDLPTPPSSATGSQRISIPSPSQSPILSYFLGQSPTKPSAISTFPFKRTFGTVPVFEADEEAEKEIPVAAHARRASAAAANRFSSQAQPVPIPDGLQDRGASLLRRLSLSTGAFAKAPFDSMHMKTPPSPPPNTAVSPTPRGAPFSNKPRRSATISADGLKARRAPSPMGERILTGHFDGFN